MTKWMECMKYPALRDPPGSRRQRRLLSRLIAARLLPERPPSSCSVWVKFAGRKRVCAASRVIAFSVEMRWLSVRRKRGSRLLAPWNCTPPEAANRRRTPYKSQYPPSPVLSVSSYCFSSVCYIFYISLSLSGMEPFTCADGGVP